MLDVDHLEFDVATSVEQSTGPRDLVGRGNDDQVFPTTFCGQQHRCSGLSLGLRWLWIDADDIDSKLFTPVAVRVCGDRPCIAARVGVHDHRRKSCRGKFGTLAGAITATCKNDDGIGSLRIGRDVWRQKPEPREHDEGNRTHEAQGAETDQRLPFRARRERFVSGRPIRIREGGGFKIDHNGLIGRIDGWVYLAGEIPGTAPGFSYSHVTADPEIRCCAWAKWVDNEAMKSPSRRLATVSPLRLRSFTRLGALARTRALQPPQLSSPLRMAAYLASGSILIGLGVSFFVHGRLGLPPYDVMLSAVRVHTGLSHGQSAWVAAAVLFSVATLLGRPPKPAGLALSFLNGFSVDAFGALLLDPESMVLRVLFAALGMLSIATGIALVIHSGTTGGAFDLIMQAGADRGHAAGRVRTILEVSVIVGGVLAGGTAGFATAAFALCIGPLLLLVSQALADHRDGRRRRIEASLDPLEHADELLLEVVVR